MTNYELLYILSPNMTGAEIKSSFLEIRDHISKMKNGVELLETLLGHPFLVKSEISKEEQSEEIKDLPIIKRKLAYPIKKNRFGFYCLINFSSESENIKKIDNYLKTNGNVLRYVILQADPMTKKGLEQLERLFARKRAEQEKEDKEKQQAKEKVVRGKEKKIEEEKLKLQKPEKKEEEVLETEKKVEKKATEDKTEGKKEEKKATEEETAKEEEEKKKDRGRKKKRAKLEDLEEKLDEILKDTMV